MATAGMVAVQENVSDLDRSPVSCDLSRLEGVASRLEECVNGLEARLAPALGKCDGSVEKGVSQSIRRDGQSDLSLALTNIADRFEIICSQVSHLSSRCEL